MLGSNSMLCTGRAAMAPGRNRQTGNVSDVDPNSFGGQLRRLRKDAGMTQEALADALGTKQGRVSEYERN